MNFKLAIFDLDGTLIDAYEAVQVSINHALAQMGKAPVDYATVRKTVGWGDRHFVQTLSGDDRLEETIEIFREHHAGYLPQGASLLPGAAEVLEELKSRGIRLAVATNRPTRFSQLLLKELDIGRYFDYVLCGDKVEPKPAPDILIAVLKHFGYKPQDAVFVGDMTVDVMTGQSAWVPTVVVTTGSSPREELERLGPVGIIESLGELEKFLDRPLSTS